jgi:hypothetical protein
MPERQIRDGQDPRVISRDRETCQISGVKYLAVLGKVYRYW